MEPMGKAISSSSQLQAKNTFPCRWKGLYKMGSTKPVQWILAFICLAEGFLLLSTAMLAAKKEDFKLR